MKFNRYVEPASTELRSFYTLITNDQLNLDKTLNLAEWCQNDTNIYYLIALSTHPDAIPYLESLNVSELNISFITSGLDDDQIENYSKNTDFLTEIFWYLRVQNDENPYKEAMDIYNGIKNWYNIEKEIYYTTYRPNDYKQRTYDPNDYKRLTNILPLNWNEFSYSCRLIGFVYSYLFNQLSPDYQLLKTNYNLRYCEWLKNYNGNEELKDVYLPPHLVRKLEAMELVMGQSIPTTNDVLVLYLNNDPTWPAYLSIKQIKDVQELEVNGPLPPATAEALFRHPEKWNETIEQLKAK